MTTNQTVETKTILAASAGDTERIGEAIGRQLRGGEVIELSSDLGGGKTTLVRGLARGAGSRDHVASPTFTLSKVYQTSRPEIHHFDFYRLQDAGIMRDEIQELINDPEVVLVVEWSDIIQAVLPEKRLVITIDRIAAKDDSRRISLSYPLELAYLC